MCPGSVSGNIQTLENVKCKLGRLPRTTSAPGYCLYGILPSAQHTIMHLLSPAMQRFHHTATQLRVDIIIIFTGDTFTVSESSHLAVSVSLPAAVRCCLVRTQDRGHFLIFTTLDSHTIWLTLTLISLSVFPGSWDRKVAQKRSWWVSVEIEEWWCLRLMLQGMRVNESFQVALNKQFSLNSFNVCSKMWKWNWFWIEHEKAGKKSWY